MTSGRRAFLQQASLALAALGLGGTTLLSEFGQYSQALAKPARRKLALLIGINQYPERAIDPILAQDVALRGCLTDVELQRQLLIHRFGFQPVDIFTLTNQEATRAAILEAIDQHLVQQADSYDVVLLHFSGYGSQVRLDVNPSHTELAWVTVDSRLPSEEKPALADLLEAELIDRLQSLATPNLTTVIDAGSQDAGYLRWGNDRVRARPTVPTGAWPNSFSGNPNRFTEAPTPWPGLLLRAGEPVLEAQWDGFSAGLLTYALTQVLWQTLPDPNPKVLIQRFDDRVYQGAGPNQPPTLTESPVKTGLLAYALPAQIPNADGVIWPATDDDRPLSLWLGGIAPDVLRYLQPGARLLTVPATDSGNEALAKLTDALELRLESRTGLKGTAKRVDATAKLPATAQPLYEKVRLLPHTIELVVALDSQLQRVERVDATSALASIPFVASIPVGERKADCLFGRLTLGPVPTLTASLPSTPEAGNLAKLGSDKPLESSYGLFTPNRNLVPGTVLPKEEAVKTAINRLTPNFQLLLAQKLVRLTENRTASWLGVSVALEALQPKAKPLLQQQTERSSSTGLLSAALGKALPGQPVGLDTVDLSQATRLLYRVASRCDQPLFLLVISFDSRSECSALLLRPESATGQEVDSTLPAAVLAPRQTQVIPGHGNGWSIPGSVTSIETYLIFSVQPLQRCLEVLSLDGVLNPLQTELQRVSQPLKLAQALLQDLNSDGAGSDAYALRQDRWATFRFNCAVNRA
ncbi:MAG: caspase family protein [Leptolyngbyaceae cyanobacterium SM2_5_2]|nr:caspase family protein [Leptolyngbyaceae cyanobacterium SM2_5_2]